MLHNIKVGQHGGVGQRRALGQIHLRPHGGCSGTNQDAHISKLCKRLQLLPHVPHALRLPLHRHFVVFAAAPHLLHHNFNAHECGQHQRHELFLRPVEHQVTGGPHNLQLPVGRTRHAHAAALEVAHQRANVVQAVLHKLSARPAAGAARARQVSRHFRIFVSALHVRRVQARALAQLLPARVTVLSVTHVRSQLSALPNHRVCSFTQRREPSQQHHKRNVVHLPLNSSAG